MAYPDPIIIADYDPAWPEAFERERDRILSALGEAMGGVDRPAACRVL